MGRGRHERRNVSWYPLARAGRHRRAMCRLLHCARGAALPVAEQEDAFVPEEVKRAANAVC